MENKNEAIENEIILGNFNCSMDKMGETVEIKEMKYFIDVVSIMPRQNSSWIMDWMI